MGILFVNIIFFLSLILNAQESNIQNEHTKSKSLRSSTQKINGFKILKIEKGSIFEQLGLRNGNIIESVNDKKIKTSSDSMELYNALKTEKNIDLVIERNGKKETLHYSIK